MNPRQLRFISVWQSAHSLESAASLLGMHVRSVTRQVNRLRAAGVQLKVMTDQRFNRYTAPERTNSLTLDQKEFIATNYDFARRVAWKACRSADVPVNLFEEFVEDAATEALLFTARRSTEPGFRGQSARGLLVTVVRRQVWGLLRKRPKQAPIGTDFLEWVPSKRFADPVQEAIQREERARARAQDELARSFVGAMPDMSRKRESAETRELLALRAKARQTDLSWRGTADEIRERLAAHFKSLIPAVNAPRADDDRSSAPASISGTKAAVSQTRAKGSKRRRITTRRRLVCAAC